MNVVNKRKKYKNDFLDKVIVRIDFDALLPIASSGPAKEIYTPVKERFPNYRREKNSRERINTRTRGNKRKNS